MPSLKKMMCLYGSFFTFYIWMRWMMCSELYQNHTHSVQWLWRKIGSRRGSSTDREMFLVSGDPGTLPISSTIVFMPSVLTPIGIPGSESVQCRIGIPFRVLYLTATIRNALLLIIIKWDPRLHEPKYIFPGMLGVTDIVLLLLVLCPRCWNWFHVPEIYFNSCLLQMWLFAFQGIASGI